jgi:hypothetical protein
MASNRDEDLFPETRNPEGTRFINERCQIRTQDDRRLVLVSAIPMAQYSVDDCMSEAYAMVSLIDQGSELLTSVKSLVTPNRRARPNRRPRVGS